MSKLWLYLYQLEYKNHHMTRAGEITETGFGYFEGILQQQRQRLGYTRNWELAHDFIS